MSLFITFEGGEGCGKSTQARLLLKRLAHHNIPAILTQEPGGTDLGRRIRGLLKRPGTTHVSPTAELLLFAASRIQLVTEVILPALADDKVVVCDRFTDSTVAYQGHGRHLDLNMIGMLNTLAKGDLMPDLTVLLDMPPERGLERRRGMKDRFELEDLSFHHRVRKAYLKLGDAEPDRWLMIDASLARAMIADIIWGRVRALLSKSL